MLEQKNVRAPLRVTRFLKEGVFMLLALHVWGEGKGVLNYS